MSKIRVKSIDSALSGEKYNIQEVLDAAINDVKKNNEYVYLVKVYFEEPARAATVSARLHSIQHAFASAGVTNGVIVPVGGRFGDLEVIELASEDIQQ